MRKHLGEIFAAGLLAAEARTGMIGGTPKAYGWTDVLVRIDTAMPSLVMVSSAATGLGAVGTGKGATRIDNWNKGLQGTVSGNLLSGRTHLCCVNVSTFSANVYVGWSNSVSTQAVVGTFDEMGEILKQDGKTCRAADRSLAVWAVAADNAGSRGVALSCEQLGKKNP